LREPVVDALKYGSYRLRKGTRLDLNRALVISGTEGDQPNKPMIKFKCAKGFSFLSGLVSRIAEFRSAFVNG
jgi:hypothetical protein